MKILFITNFCPHYHKKPFEEMARRFDIDFIFFSKGENYHEGKNTVNKLKIKYSYLLPSINRPLELYKKIQNGKYDIIVKCVVGGYLTIYSFLIAKKFGAKFIFWSNIWHYSKKIRSKIARKIHFYLYTNSNAIVTYGAHIDKFIEQNIPELNLQKIFHSYNVIDNSLFDKQFENEKIKELKNKYSIKAKRILLYTGRISEEKGLIYLLQAYANIEKKYDDVFLLIIGEGDMIPLIKDKNIKYIKQIGRIDNQELYKYYSLSDIFILPSITSEKCKETWGVVINEAMNCGNAIVATDAVGAAVGGLLKDGETGYVVREQNSEDLELAIEKLLLDEKLLREMQKRNKEIIKNFDEKMFVNGFQDAFEYVINE